MNGDPQNPETMTQMNILLQSCLIVDGNSSLEAMRTSSIIDELHDIFCQDDKRREENSGGMAAKDP